MEIENKIILGDCIEELKRIPSESIDLVITDPPYFISQAGGKISRNYQHYKWKRNSDILLDFGEWDREWNGIEEYIGWTEEWFKEVVRVMKKGAWIYIFFDKQKIGIFDLILAPKYGIKSRTVFVWIKSNPTPSFRKVNWVSATEFIWVGSKGDSKLKNFKLQKEMNNYFIHPNGSSYKETNHPTEKPIRIIQHFIECSSNDGDLVLDCFAGSGSVGVACILSGRKYLLIEKNKEYFEMMMERIRKYQYQGSLI